MKPLADRFPLLARRPWVKVCGVTRPEDAALAVELGATMIGMNFWPRSKRVVEPSRAREIVAAVGGRAPVAGVFVDEDPERIEALLEATGFDLVQLHGDEPDEVVARFGPRALRALRAQPGRAAAKQKTPKKGKGKKEGPSGGGAEAGVRAAGRPGSASAGAPSLRQHAFPSVEELRRCFALLVDGPAGDRYGGTGESWDWSRARGVVERVSIPVLIAGGIGPETAAAALSASGAAGVDVASGVETSPGFKDPEKMMRLMDEFERLRTGTRGSGLGG